MPQQIRLLIVEDDDNYFKLLRKYFAIKTLSRLKINIQVERASNLTEAMLKFYSFAPHAVLLDLHFPDDAYPRTEWMPDTIAAYLEQKSDHSNQGNLFLAWVAELYGNNREVEYPVWVISSAIDTYQAPQYPSHALALHTLDKAHIKDKFLPALDEYFSMPQASFISVGGVQARFSRDGTIATIIFWGAYAVGDIMRNLSLESIAQGAATSHGEHMRNLDTLVLDISMVADTHRALPGLNISRHEERGVQPPRSIYVVHNPQQKPNTIRMHLLTLFPQLATALQQGASWYNQADSRIFLYTSLQEAERHAYQART